MVLLTLLNDYAGVRAQFLVAAALAVGANATAIAITTRTVGANLREVVYVDSSRYVLKATTCRRWFTDRERFASWRGDLLLASLFGELRRVHVEAGRAVVLERIEIGGRIRDKEHTSTGPNLWQIVGRRVGADETFDYSEPM